jgi:hypothetical protein
VLADPQTVTIDSTPVTLNATGRAIDKSAYKSADNLTQLEISHSYGNRVRRLVRVNFDIVGTDPVDASLSKPYSMSAYLVVDHPLVGFTASEIEDNVQGLVDYLDTAGFIADLIEGQS